MRQNIVFIVFLTHKLQELEVIKFNSMSIGPLVPLILVQVAKKGSKLFRMIPKEEKKKIIQKKLEGGKSILASMTSP